MLCLAFKFAYGLLCITDTLNFNEIKLILFMAYTFCVLVKKLLHTVV